MVLDSEIFLGSDIIDKMPKAYHSLVPITPYSVRKSSTEYGVYTYVLRRSSTIYGVLPPPYGGLRTW